MLYPHKRFNYTVQLCCHDPWTECVCHLDLQNSLRVPPGPCKRYRLLLWRVFVSKDIDSVTHELQHGALRFPVGQEASIYVPIIL